MAKLSPNEIAFVAQAAGFTGDDLVTAVAVSLAESGGDTDVLARSTVGDNVGNRDHGLWQISNRWHPEKLAEMGPWRNPFVNARMAFKIYSDAGKKFTPWKVFGSKGYEQFLPDARIAVKQPFRPLY